MIGTGRVHLPKLGAIVAALFLTVFFGMSSAFGATSGTVWFHSPSGNIECEVSPGGPHRAARAYCQTAHPSASVSLRPSGKLRICHGQGCIGNGPENASTLAYGHSMLVGPFRCTSSRQQGMKCIVRQTGKGFVIAQQGITRIG
jgi:hypothetical protein